MNGMKTLAELGTMVHRSKRTLWREINRGRLAKPVPGKPARLFAVDVDNYVNLLRAEQESYVGGSKIKRKKGDGL